MKSRVKTYVNLYAVCLAVALGGCSALQQKTQPEAPQPSAQSAPATGSRSTAAGGDVGKTQKIKVGDIEGEIIGAPMKNSKFAKVRIGMGKKEVEDLIGAPNDSKQYLTGKAFIPFYFGADSNRFQTFYKKEGSLTYQGGGAFGSTGKLIRISVNTAADGYAHDD